MTKTCDRCGKPKQVTAGGRWMCMPCHARVCRAARGGTDDHFPCGHPRTETNTRGTRGGTRGGICAMCKSARQRARYRVWADEQKEHRGTCDKCGQPKHLNARGYWVCTPCRVRARRLTNGGSDEAFPCGHPRIEANTTAGRGCRSCMLAYHREKVRSDQAYREARRSRSRLENQTLRAKARAYDLLMQNMREGL